MKQKVIYLFAMLCFAQTVMAQEQKTYLVTEGKQWAVYYEQSWNQDQPVVTHTFRLQGDTIINEFTYKKKWMSVEKDLSDWFLLPSYMREENGKVYVMNSRGEESLWFDYNAQVGDTLCLTSKQATQQCYGLVTSIDNFVLEHSDGKQRKRYEVVLGREAMSGDVYFTDSHIYIHEDVGMFNSPNYGYGLGDHTLFNYGNKFMLLCVHDNGIALYQSPEGCYKEVTPKTYLVTEGKQWAVCTYSFRGDHWTNTYRLRGDTTINGKTYKIEHESQEVDLSDMRPSGRYMREENGKVYSITDKDKREELFFDYTMQVGDTLRYNPTIDYYGNVSDSYQCIRLVAIRDTVMPNGDGKVRKSYHVQSGRYEEGVYRFNEDIDGRHVFIEDIGFVFDGLSHPTIDIVGSWSTLLYVKQDDTMLYQEKEGVVWSNSSSEEDKAPYLVKEGKKWHIRTEVPYVNKNMYDIFMWVEGDTIINGVSYKKLHKQTRNVMDSSMGTFEIGYCHQANNRYYQNGELMFDFSLQEGDVFYPRKGDPLTVRRTGKMALDDGIMRKYLLMVADTQDPDTTYNADYWIEGIGSLKTGILTNDFTSDGLIKELQSCIYNGEYIYKSKTNETKPVSRPTNRKGYGIYYDDSYLYRYTINEAEEVTDSTDFARWHDKTVIYFDVDSVGRDAFANACFRQGQILYFTEKLRYIGQDAFGDILMLDEEPEAKNPFGDLCIVFSGDNPPSIDENSIVNYADTTYRITYVVPDLATYIEDDMQWTYSQLVTIDDFIAGYISPENEVAVSDSTGVDLEVGMIEDNSITSGAALYVAARPKKDIPVRIGDGENKDIYSRAPAWMRYTVEVVMTDSKGDTLYTDKQQCNAYDGCYFEVTLTTLPEDGIVCVYSRSIDQYGNASDWTMKKIHLMNIDSVAAPENHSPYYDLMGREVAHPTRGIYIKDGRKVVIE